MKALKTFIKPFEAPQRSMKIKIELNFFTSSGTGTGRVNLSVDNSNLEAFMQAYDFSSFIKKPSYYQRNTPH